ncbi:MAG: hypothetical protein E7A34_17385, partial [Leclercia adecarboxylata]|nr:hypothetical protein [Leclercia adecarboxylata]
ELEKGFTNEGVVHELSWIPGVQTGAELSAIAAGKGIDLRQKKPHQTQSFTFHPSFIHFLAFILRINHLVE